MQTMPLNPSHRRMSLAFIAVVILVLAAMGILYVEQPKPASSYLHLNLSVTPASGNGQMVSADMWETNILGQNNTLSAMASNWPIANLHTYACVQNYPLAMNLFKGHDTGANVSQAESVPYSYSVFCPASLIVFNTLTFLPHSSMAVADLATSSLTPTWDINQTYYFQGVSPGDYTVVAGDEWGHVVFGYFTVAA